MKRNSQVGGSGHGDVGEQQPGDALAFPHRGGGVVPDGGQVGGQLAVPITVIDIASRRVVGFALADHLRTGGDLPFRPRLPVRLRRVRRPGGERGCQYASAAFAALAEDCQVALSVGRRGQCWDNALAESFFASLKGELIDTRPCPTRVAAHRAIVGYIGWYNGTRLHST